MKKKLVATIALIVLCLPRVALAADKPIVGTIRYDAWTPHVVRPDLPKEEHYLSPEIWHYRLPWFANIIAPTQVEVDGDSQEVVDQEILDASSAGIDYFAFDYYRFWWQDDNPQAHINYGLNYYLASQYKNKINFTLLIVVPDPLDHYKDTFVPKIVELIKQPTYQKVLNGRPLLYIFDANNWIKYFNCPSSPHQDPPTCADTSLIKLQEGLIYLRQQIMAANLSNPYIVSLVWWPETEGVNLHTAGFDAVSQYSAPDYDPGTFDQGRPFSDLVVANARFREKAKQAGLKAIPIVNTGWDSRPFWVNGDAQHNNWYNPSTPAEITANLKTTIDWNINNPTVGEAKTILIYAWNEYAEGGWLGKMLDGSNDRLNSIKTLLATYSPSPTPTLTPTPSSKPGDANKDGKVDLADFSIWKGEYLNKIGLTADFNKDSKVDLADFSIWKMGYLGI